jgi:N-acetylneuraminate synthase
MKIIAEIGINHDGLIQKAKKLIDESFHNCVDAIKFQYRNLNNTYSDNANEIGDEILSKEINRNYLSPDELIDLSSYAKGLGLEVGISFFDVKDIEDFEEMIEIFDFFKIPSVELTNSHLIDALLTFVYLSWYA